MSPQTRHELNHSCCNSLLILLVNYLWYISWSGLKKTIFHSDLPNVNRFHLIFKFIEYYSLWLIMRFF